MNTNPKHFLTLSDLTAEQILALIDRAIELKTQRKNHQPHPTLKGKILAMIFEKASTRTRISFEAGIIQLGGQALFIASKDSQMGRGEPIFDTAKVISSMVDLVMMRTYSHQTITEFAENSTVPVINGLTEEHHPCQLLADLMTIKENFPNLENLKITWIGDGNNMCNSTIELAHILGLELAIYTPEGYQPQSKHLPKSNKIKLCNNLEEAIKDSHIVSTDVWASMGDEQQAKQRQKAFAHCQVNQKNMQLADKNAIFLHCLPAHRGEEVTAEVIDGTQSRVWQQAENRLHAQKALMEHLLN
jgi:ornithine carbamoyltransferase